jgi:hypothetical protein
MAYGSIKPSASLSDPEVFQHDQKKYHLSFSKNTPIILSLASPFGRGLVLNRLVAC